MRQLSPGRVAVHAHNARLREKVSELLLEFFRPRAKVFDITAPAYGTGRRNFRVQITVMADKRPVRMIYKRQAADLTIHNCTAGAAHDEGGVAAPIQHDDCLFTTRKRLRQERLQRCRDD